jgi:hypothetical protein
MKVSWHTAGATVVLLFVCWAVYGQTEYCCPGTSSAWRVDSLYLGLGFVARSADDSVYVIWKPGDPYALGVLSMMVPGRHDSAMHIFHNMIGDYPGEDTSVSLGTFPVGTPLVFRYVQLEPVLDIMQPVGKRLYTGQNRPGIDEYVCEMESPLGPRWSLGGRVHADTCEAAFASAMPGSYREVMFTITNVYREQLDRYQVAAPAANPPAGEYDHGVSVELATATVGHPRIYYTLDGTPPDTTSPVYDGPIAIERTCTLRAFASMRGDTQWVDSDVMSATYAGHATGAGPIVPRADTRRRTR